MRHVSSLVFGLVFLLLGSVVSQAATLPFDTVFKGREKFQRMVTAADEGNWKSLPIGERTATVGRWLAGTPYKSYSLEIDDHIEAPSVNLLGLDCWTLFEVSLGFARMLDEPHTDWTPQMLLHYIELDRYRGGHCDGTYLSRLHYLEDWLWDNDRRGMVMDLTRRLGGVRVENMAREMTVGWRGYRYLVMNPELREGIARHEARIAATPFYHIPKSKVPQIEKYLRTGDIIGITAKDGAGVGTSHVGLAVRTPDGVLHFMHASSPRNYGKVVLDVRLSDYLARYSLDKGIIVARPLK